MTEVILRRHFPAGELPVRGFRCAICGDEGIRGEDAHASELLAEKLGLYGVENGRTRKILRTGGSFAVTLDPGLLRKVIGKPQAGKTVRVGLQGKRIVIEAADEE